MVEILLLEQDRIKAEADFESDHFNDLILVQSKLKEMIDSNKISPEYLVVLNTVLSSKNFEEAGEKLGISKNMVIRKFAYVCDLIGEELGYWFTDGGLIEAMKQNYHLDAQELVQLSKFIEKRFKYYRKL